VLAGLSASTDAGSDAAEEVRRDRGPAATCDICDADGVAHDGPSGPSREGAEEEGRRRAEGMALMVDDSVAELTDARLIDHAAASRVHRVLFLRALL
jgi:hypothetical protein